MKVVILAAGRGERLRPFTQARPKPLLKIFDRPLLEHIIRSFKHAGVMDFIVVTGYLGRAIREHFGDGARLSVKIRYAHNTDYDRGNADSLGAAEGLLTKDEPFLLSMADHLFDARIVERTLKNLERRPLLCVDRKPRYLLEIEEATKVLVGEDGYIMDIGKGIPHWNGVDTGIFLLDTSIFKVIKEVEAKANPLTLSRCMKHLIENHSLWACNVSGSFWLDVDSWEDMAHARIVGKP